MSQKANNITITLFLRAVWSIMALVNVLKPDIVIVGPSRRRGLTITMEGFKRVTRAIIDHAAQTNIALLLLFSVKLIVCIDYSLLKITISTY